MSYSSDIHTSASANAQEHTSAQICLPFEGAQLHASQATYDPEHPESSELDHNPRYRRISGFVSGYLPGQRDVHLYLPQAYLTAPTRRFPVFYLHDGQNLIDGRTSYLPGHTWRAHRAADALTASGAIEPIILVAINNAGERRMAEYTPTRDPALGGGEGLLYGRMIVEELKPLLDATLRTLPDAASTALGGSSLGGLISLFLGLQYPHVFAKLAILSPSLWWNDRALLNTIKTSPRPAPNAKLWLDIGTAEGPGHVRDCDQLHRMLAARGWRENISMQYHRIPEGLHNEDAWADRFDQVLRFLFPSQTSQ